MSSNASSPKSRCSSTKFNPATDIPDLSDKTVLITGATSGLGEATACAIAQHSPGLLYIGARSAVRGAETIERIRASSPAAASANIEVLILDLASLASVAAAAAKVNSEAGRLDLVQLNGGVGGQPHGTTHDGYELRIGTNYLGHALLVQLLMPKMLETARLPGADVRIVSIASVGHNVFAPKGGILVPTPEKPNSLRGSMEDTPVSNLYGQSHLAKVLLARSLARRYPSITTTSLHPGTVNSNIWENNDGLSWVLRNLFFRPVRMLTGVSNEVGALTGLWCSFTDKENINNGAYYEPVGKAGNEGKYAKDDVVEANLWAWMEGEIEKSELGRPEGWVKV